MSSGLVGELSGHSFLLEVRSRIPPSDASLCLRSGPESIYPIKMAHAPVLSHQTLDPSTMKTSWILKFFPRVSLPHTALYPPSPPISLSLPLSFTHTHTLLHIDLIHKTILLASGYLLKTSHLVPLTALPGLALHELAKMHKTARKCKKQKNVALNRSWNKHVYSMRADKRRQLGLSTSTDDCECVTGIESGITNTF